ncbi:MAG: FIST C-terminal domain-containing protein [Gammaproteobacteria bacterium]|nr:FIST C-terminal domain-containing protein [Gammaproteobacteria bacterium]
MLTRQTVLFAPSVDAAALQATIDNDPQLLLVFCSVSFLRDDRFRESLQRAFPSAAIAGCSTAGEIHARGVENGSCVITGLRFNEAQFRIAESSVAGIEQSLQGGKDLGSQLTAPDLRAVLLFGRGVNINGSALIDGLAGAIGKHVPITGGLAGDDGAFVDTAVLTPSGTFNDGVVAVGLYGDRLRVGHGSFGGWQPYGPARRVTRCDGNILHELDGEPALNIYKNYLGDYARDLPASGLLFPFEMLGSDHDQTGLIRTILGIDEATGSLVLAGDIAPNGYLRLMHATTDGLTDGAARAAETAAADFAGEVDLALLVSCVGRKLVMGDLVEDEVEAVTEHIGGQTVVTGFYSYGEISPFSNTTDCKLHNQTMTVTFIGEAA